MAQRRHLRASDADRDHVAERLRNAASEGRLATDELEQRLGTALSARTYGELDSVVADLPGNQASRPRARGRRALSTVSAHPLLILAALPFLLAAVAIITGLAALWAIWVAFAWLAFGRRRPRHGRRGFGAYQRSGAPSRYWA